MLYCTVQGHTHNYIWIILAIVMEINSIIQTGLLRWLNVTDFFNRRVDQKYIRIIILWSWIQSYTSVMLQNHMDCTKPTFCKSGQHKLSWLILLATWHKIVSTRNPKNSLSIDSNFGYLSFYVATALQNHGTFLQFLHNYVKIKLFQLNLLPISSKNFQWNIYLETSIIYNKYK